MTVAARVAEEAGTTLGQAVGYGIRFEDVTTPVSTSQRFSCYFKAAPEAARALCREHMMLSLPGWHPNGIRKFRIDACRESQRSSSAQTAC